MAGLLEALYGYLDSLNTEKDDRIRTGVFHPSELAGCSRAIYYSFTGAPRVSKIPPALRMTFDQGHKIHDMLQGYFEKYYGSDFQREVAIKTAHPILGSCDGVIQLRPDLRVGIEIKSAKQGSYKEVLRKGAYPDHIMQANIYAACLKLPFIHILYVNKNGELDKKKDVQLAIHDIRIDFDPQLWALVESKMIYIKECASKKEPPPQDISYKCPRCPYFEVCQPKLKEDEWSNSTQE
jgi:CRISPR/Cas system-associated exonuclease Cas4 (RecB family)